MENHSGIADSKDKGKKTKVKRQRRKDKGEKVVGVKHAGTNKTTYRRN